MQLREYKISVTTNGSGAATGYTQEEVNGQILGIGYVKTDFADGHVMTFTGAEKGLPLFTATGVNATALLCPRMPARNSADGTAALYASGGTAVMGGPPVVANEKVKLVVASGGDTKSGTYYLLVLE